MLEFRKIKQMKDDTENDDTKNDEIYDELEGDCDEPIKMIMLKCNMSIHYGWTEGNPRE